MNADEIREELAKRGISVMRKVIADDISVLNEYGYEVLSYKKKYYCYYVVSRPIETAEVVMLADAVNASKLPATQKKALVERLSSFLCSHQAESVSKHIISFEKGRKGSSSLIYNVDSIERAINENKKISFLYFDYDDKHKKVYRKEGKRYVVIQMQEILCGRRAENGCGRSSGQSMPALTKTKRLKRSHEKKD